MTSSIADRELTTKVDVVLEVARMHGSSVSVNELLKLLPNGVRTEDVLTALESTPKFASTYALRDGLIVLQVGQEVQFDDYHGRLERSRVNIERVKWLTSKLSSPNALTISVSGSTSYRAASKGDDVDLFCVTSTNTMWLFLAKALLFARVSRIFRRSAESICLSCTMDDRYARSMFSIDRGALFARDALMAVVVRGDEHYSNLIASASWMDQYFPELFAAKSGTRDAVAGPVAHASLLLRSVNRFLFIVLGSYIRMKVNYHNRLLARTRNPLAFFNARIGVDHLIYESGKYLKLREMYGEIRPESDVTLTELGRKS